MERSSPLAAMQPPALPMGPWGFRKDMSTAGPQFRSNPFASTTFDFRELSMKKPSSDYFAMQPVRGSSPTASLAADLSQNFHIDQSPQLPTPRRSLFTNNLFATIDGRENVTTPPIPSSSPGPQDDSMDISPLPHKIPFTLISEVEVAPTPLEPTDTSMLSSPPIVSVDNVEETRPNIFADRKKSFLRPSLVRTKGYSTNNVPSKTSMPEAQLPPFKFGAGSKLSTSTSMSLSECFTASPPQDRVPLFGQTQLGLMPPPRPRQQFSAMSGVNRTGSPSNANIRKASNPLNRPRKQFRRTLSMFENPADMMKQEKKTLCPAPPLASTTNAEDHPSLLLPHFVPEDRPDSLPRISKETLVDVLDGKYKHLYDQTLIVDCRFEYEYEGGHIEGAVNYNDKDVLSEKLFESPSPPDTLIVLHCEYSAHRAPIMAKFVRHQDRAYNDFRYPKLTYPEVYILDGGYSSFFNRYRSRCFPQNYVEMDSAEHASACERGMDKLRQRRKLSRAQTFAFGSHGQGMQDSPTAVGRSTGDSMMMTDLFDDSMSDTKRLSARRMASY